MKIDELLQTRLLDRSIDDVMSMLKTRAQKETTKLVNTWHQDIKLNPNAPHPALVILAQTEEMINATK
jgi:hypothetical protein